MNREQLRRASKKSKRGIGITRKSSSPRKKKLSPKKYYPYVDPDATTEEFEDYEGEVIEEGEILPMPEALVEYEPTEIIEYSKDETTEIIERLNKVKRKGL